MATSHLLALLAIDLAPQCSRTTHRLYPPAHSTSRVHASDRLDDAAGALGLMRSRSRTNERPGAVARSSLPHATSA
eukprot:4380466-Pyramimonas_sp.AAC.2